MGQRLFFSFEHKTCKVRFYNILIRLKFELCNAVNVPLRDYQFAITQKALFSNTLVALPTGLGKTLIAAVVMYNYFRWFPDGNIIPKIYWTFDDDLLVIYLHTLVSFCFLKKYQFLDLSILFYDFILYLENR